jgi:hypothetical protein
MLVPSQTSQCPSGVEERTPSPGAVTSGLSRSEIGVGPADENGAMSSAGWPSPSLEAATAIAAGALAGEPIEPRPAFV